MKLRKTPVQGQGFVRPENQNLQNFGEIIPVISGVIGGRETNIVSARTLHNALGVGRDFTNWIKGRIEEYGFKKGVDFEVVKYLTSPNSASAKSRQQLAHDYLLTLNMAKELAMIERTEQGRAVRQYFIKCEEELHKVAPVRSAALRRELKARITVASYFKPMCAALEISNVTDAVSVLDNDEVMTLALTEGHSGKRGGARSWNVVSESGFYKLIARSRKASTLGTFAHRFSNWVFREVIPSIRKTGGYGVPFAMLNDFSKRQAAYQQEASKRGYRLQQCKEAKDALEREERALWRKYQPDFLEGESNV